MRVNITNSIFLLHDGSSPCGVTPYPRWSIQGVWAEMGGQQTVMGELTALEAWIRGQYISLSKLCREDMETTGSADGNRV